MNAKKLLTKPVEDEGETMEQLDYLKIPEVCRRLRLGRTAVYGLMERGELQYAKFGRARRVGRESLEAYIERATFPARV